MEPLSSRARTGLAVFAIIVVAAPLAIGAVDRAFQIPLTLLLGIGLLVAPPSMPRLGRATAFLLAALVIVLAGKEFLPAEWFGLPSWRRILIADYGLELPATHNPSPAAAADTILVALVACGWFLWLRSLAAPDRGRLAILSVLALSATVLAVVSLWMKLAMPNSELIYGIRVSPGWQQFGPFPNRNHTACFLGMGAITGVGLAVQFHALGRRGAVVLSSLASVVLVAATIASRSRGGLLALFLGLAVLGGLVFVVSRRRAILVVALSAVFLLAGASLFFGGGTIDRFFSPAGRALDLPTARFTIWNDTLQLWQEAPLFGHGAATFAGTYPFHQTLAPDNARVIHPESSWLQWLTELGLVPMVIALVLLAALLLRSARQLRDERLPFPLLRATPLAAIAAFACNSIYEVPGHRWATAGFAIALLALAAAPSCSDPRRPERRLPAVLGFLPILVALVWSLPWFSMAAPWTPLSVEILLRDATKRTDLTPADAGRVVRHFPLNPHLHELAGVLDLRDPLRRSQAYSHFKIENRLVPSSWGLPAQQAINISYYDLPMSLSFWTVAISRAGKRDGEVFHLALGYSPDIPLARDFWHDFVRLKPELLLNFAAVRPEDEATQLYQLWLRERAAGGQPLTENEIQTFYNVVTRVGRPADLAAWMQARPGRAATDRAAWARILRYWGDSEGAWNALSPAFPEPSAEEPPHKPLDELRQSWLLQPENWVNTQAYVIALEQAGQAGKAADVLKPAIAANDCPEWFRRKAAYVLAAEGNYEAAVSLLPKP